LTLHNRVQKPKRIGLLEHFGTGNLGDDATVDAVLQQIRSRWPYASITGLSLDPSDSEERHGIPCYPIRQGNLFFSPEPPEPATGSGAGFKDKLRAVLGEYRLLFLVQKTRRLFKELLFLIQKPWHFFKELLFLAKSFRVAKSLDLLVVSGGGQLLDAWGGPWAFPYTLFKWVLLAKLAGTKCYFVNVGAGPLRYRLSKWFVRRSLLFADYVSFRDDKSKALIREIGFSGEASVVTDSAYALQISEHDKNTSRARRESELVIGISPMAWRDPRRYWDKDQSSYECFIRKLADFCARLIRSHHRLRLFSSDIWFDSQAIVDLEAAIKNDFAIDTASCITCEPISGIDDFLSQLSQVDCLVTCKFHGVVFGHLLNVPLLAIAHHPKVSTLMEDFELAEYCVDIRKFDVGLLTETFERLVANIDDIKVRTPQKVAFYRRELAAQFDQLFPSAHTGLCTKG
jgi:polysaccharide pyruvyl transferase WcaK-like protein